MGDLHQLQGEQRGLIPCGPWVMSWAQGCLLGGFIPPSPKRHVPGSGGQAGQGCRSLALAARLLHPLAHLPHHPHCSVLRCCHRVTGPRATLLQPPRGTRGHHSHLEIFVPTVNPCTHTRSLLPRGPRLA